MKKKVGDTMLKDRMQHLINVLDVKKGDFAKKIGFSQAYISRILSGVSLSPSPRFYETLKREYNVNPQWLKDGIGDIFIQNEVLSSEDEEAFKKYNQLSSSERKIIVDIIDAMFMRNQIKSTSKDE